MMESEKSENLEPEIIKKEEGETDVKEDIKPVNCDVQNNEEEKSFLTTEVVSKDVVTNPECLSEVKIEVDQVDVVPKRKRGRPKGFSPKKYKTAMKNLAKAKIKENSSEVQETGDLLEVKEEDCNNIKEENSSDTPKRPGRKRGVIYDETDDPDTRKAKMKKRSIDLKLKKLQISAQGFEEPGAMSGKRQKKAPQRFELPVAEKRKFVHVGKGRGEFFHSIRWVSQHIRAAKLDTLRALHRIVYRKQGMFQEKQIIKNLLKFNGFPFNASHPEYQIRQERVEKLKENVLRQFCEVLCIRPGTKDVMVRNIMHFLMFPSQKSTEPYMEDIAKQFNQNQVIRRPNQIVLPGSSAILPAGNPSLQKPFTNTFPEDEDPASFPMFNFANTKIDLVSTFKKPPFFTEGPGVKLKYIRAVIANIQAASDAFIELLHRLLYLTVDEKTKMRRNILEFSGLTCEVGTPSYVYRFKILSILPIEQLKLICRVLCLSTWHKSRTILTDAIMDFLAHPRVSVMKKRVPPIFADEILFSFDSANKSAVTVTQAKLPELKNAETEVMEIVPDVHIPDENASHQETDFQMENDYLGVKLKNFSNIHYQVITTHTSLLADVHMILFLTSAAPHTIRKNILEFSGFPFDQNTKEFLCRRTLMDQYGVEALRRVATVLCVSQYICDNSKKSLIDAILKFLLKPSALLSSSTIMPTISPISQNPLIKASTVPVVKNNATSTSEKKSRIPPTIVKPEIEIQPVGASGNSKTSVKSFLNAVSLQKDIMKQDNLLELEKVKARLSIGAIDITPIPMPAQTTEKSRRKPARPTKVIQPESILPDDPEEQEIVDISDSEINETISLVKKSPEAPPLTPNTPTSQNMQQCYSSDDDDQPLSRMVGHPNDDQLKNLVSKIIKESKLEDITMKLVVKKVFQTYPNYDLNYRKEFIKSNVRLLLSQMEDQTCSVSTTVINI